VAASRYTAEIDLQAADTTHALAVLAVQPGSVVLDIGAADGSVASELGARGCRVYAVELDPQLAIAARSACERVVEADVETLDLAAAFDGLEFDVVLLLDVLEHLRDPAATLRSAAERLKPGGRAIVSVPNVTHGALRLELLSGRFRYTEAGLLDRTHLRFFDRAGLEQLIEGAGLAVHDRMRIARGLTDTEIEIDPDAFAPETIATALADPDAETYQFVYIVSREQAPATVLEPASLPEVLQRRAHEAERLRAQAAEYARSLEERVAALAHAAELEPELNERMQELTRVDEALRSVRLDVAIKDEQLLSVRSEIAALRAERDQARRVLGYARHRIVDRLSAVTHHVPPLHAVLKRATERVGYGPK
jgi:2-polyprenyl-3-methyl-5-hydroxy-6-metoxy-1,4-benzoquinol methylase